MNKKHILNNKHILNKEKQIYDSVAPKISDVGGQPSGIRPLPDSGTYSTEFIGAVRKAETGLAGQNVVWKKNVKSTSAATPVSDSFVRSLVVWWTPESDMEWREFSCCPHRTRERRRRATPSWRPDMNTFLRCSATHTERIYRRSRSATSAALLYAADDECDRQGAASQHDLIDSSPFLSLSSH